MRARTLYYLLKQQVIFCFFFFNDTATTEIYTLSLHDALPISLGKRHIGVDRFKEPQHRFIGEFALLPVRSEEHTSELQSHSDLVCRLLLEKKNNISAVARLTA